MRFGWLVAAIILLWVPLRGLAVGPVSPADLAVSSEFVDEHEERLSVLFESLDLQKPELREVAQAYAANDLGRASRELLEYFQQKEGPYAVPPLPDIPSDYLEQAADALDDIFTLQDIRAKQPRLPSGRLDWEHRGPRDDQEWAWLLNRHLYFVYLHEAWRETGEARYIKKLNELLTDWVLANPYPDRLTFSASWRALESARRILESWAPLFFLLQESPDFTPEARLLMLSSIPEHADSLRHHASFWGGNHLLTEKTALLAIAAAWPEFKDAGEWIDYTVEKTAEEIFAQSYPDGAYKELTNHYQRVVLMNLQTFLDLLAASGATVDPALRERAEEMWNYFAYVMRPDGWGPLNSASDLEWNGLYIEDAAPKYGRDDWAYIASAGHLGERPEGSGSIFFPYAGHAVMRSGWERAAHWAFFDIGPHGTAHQHDDRLHLSVYSGGQPVLVDSGRYTYLPGKWREYFKGSESHNVVEIEGYRRVNPPREVSEPLPVVAITESQWDFFSANEIFRPEVWGAGTAHHNRSVFYLRDRYWLVVDRVKAPGPARITTSWNFHPDLAVHPRGDGLAATLEDAPIASVTVLPLKERRTALELERGRQFPTPSGWYSKDYNLKEPATRARWTTMGSGIQTMIWLIAPLTESMPERPEITVEEAGHAVRISATHRDQESVELALHYESDLPRPEVLIEPAEIEALVTRIFPDADREKRTNWYFSPSFGWFEASSEFWPVIRHNDHGWLRVEKREDTLWLWNVADAYWMWTSLDRLPLIYHQREENGGWIKAPEPRRHL